jgi:hypothetical protein
MTTPTPHIGLRGELDDLLEALAGLKGTAARRAIKREVYLLFDLATARPATAEPASDSNGTAPEHVEARLFATLPEEVTDPLNGLDPPPR